MTHHETPAGGPRRILIIKPSSLGDIVHALPVLAALREAHPAAHIAWLIGTGFAPLLEKHPMIDELILFDRARYGRMWRSPRVFVEFWSFVGDLRKRRFDLVIDLQGLIRSGLMAWLSGARETIGFADAREGAWLFYKRRVRCPGAAVHAVDKNLCVARALGLNAAPRFPLHVSDEERAAADSLLRTAAGRRVVEFVAVVPGARWESKLWPAERFAKLIDHFQEITPCVLLGAPSDRPLAERIRATCRTPPIDLIGRTSLRELAALLETAECVVGCDSGPMHIAAALETPVTALFGPTSSARTGPYSPHAHVVSLPLPCAPCLQRICPLKHHDCMEKLPVELVLGAIGSTKAVAQGDPAPVIPGL